MIIRLLSSLIGKYSSILYRFRDLNVEEYHYLEIWARGSLTLQIYARYVHRGNRQIVCRW